MAEAGQHADTPEMILQHPEGLCLALRCTEMPEAHGEWSPKRVKWAPSPVKWWWSGKPGVLRETLPQTGGSALLLRAEVGLVWIPRTTIDHATRLWAQSPGPTTFDGEVRGLSTETCGVRPLPRRSALIPSSAMGRRMTSLQRKEKRGKELTWTRFWMTCLFK